MSLTPSAFTGAYLTKIELMPSLSQALSADVSGYSSTPPSLAAKVVTQMITEKAKANPTIRCPLPPFNIDPDTLRQFETGTGFPLTRIIPLPPITGSSPSSSTATVISTSSSSTVVPVPTTIKALSVTFQTGALLPGASFVGSVQMSKSFQLLSVSCSSEAEVRIYGTSASQSFDNGRALDAPVPPEITTNIIADAILDSSPFSWAFQNVIGADQNATQTATIYVSVYNIAAAPVSNISTTIGYVPLQNA